MAAIDPTKPGYPRRAAVKLNSVNYRVDEVRDPSTGESYEIYAGDTNRPDLAEQLRARYPGIRIHWCHQNTAGDNGYVGLSVRFQAPRKQLIAAGLATEKMFRHRDHLRTEFGEYVGLYRELDERSRAGCWDLCIHRDVETRDDVRADGMAVTKKLQREVAKMIRRAVSLPPRRGRRPP